MRKFQWSSLSILAGVCFAAQALAGGAINKTNRSVEFMRTLARNAATDSADAVTYNPAGTVKLGNGFHLSSSVQYLIEKNYKAKFAGNEYETDAHSVLPSLFGVYNTGQWAAFFGVDLPVGGGTVDYQDGNFISYGIGQSIAMKTRLPLLKHAVEAQSYGLALTGGGAYRVSDMMAFSLAVRYITATSQFEGHALNGPMKSNIDFEAEADGVGGILGVDFFPNAQTTVGLRFATATELEYDYNVKKGPQFLAAVDIHDGDKKRDDLPAELGLGVSYQLTPQLRTEIGLNYFFNEDADIGGSSLREGLEDRIDNSWELGVTGEYALSDSLKLSMGYLYTSIGVDPENSSHFLPDLDSHTIAAGSCWKASPKMAVNFALGYTYYDSDSYVNYSLGQPIEIEFEKHIPFVALGIQYHF